MVEHVPSAPPVDVVAGGRWQHGRVVASRRHADDGERAVSLRDRVAQKARAAVPRITFWRKDDHSSAADALTLISSTRSASCAGRYPYRSRVYFLDPDGQEWEFVQYRTDDQHQRHDYELPDRYVPA